MNIEEVTVKSELSEDDSISIEYDELIKKSTITKSDLDTTKKEYTVEQKIVTATWWHEKDHNKQTIVDINKNFKLRFPDMDVPDVELITKWERLLFTEGEISEDCEINLEEEPGSEDDEESLSDNPDLES